MNGYNFTERVRAVLTLARKSAFGLGHEYVGTEHILLGLLEEGDGVGCAVLMAAKVDPARLRDRIVEVAKRGNPARSNTSELPYTSRAKKVLELAMTEARDLDHSYVGTEHLLLGLLREAKGVGAQVLIEAGLSVDTAREEVVRILGAQPDWSRSEGAVETPIGRRPRSMSQPMPELREITGVAISIQYSDGSNAEGTFTTRQDAVRFLATN